MKRSKLLLLVSPVVLITTAYFVVPGLLSSSSDDFTLGRAFPKTGRVVYDLDWSSDTTAGMPGAGGQGGTGQAALQNLSVALQLRGTLAIRRAESRSSLPTYCISFPAISGHKALVFGKNALPDAKAVKTTFSELEGCFDLDDKGLIGQFYFPSDAPVLFKQFVQGIMETLQYTTAPKGADKWRGEELNTLGTAVSQYRFNTRSKKAIAWTRNEYRELKGLPPWAQKAEPIIDGRGEIYFDAQPSFKKLSGEESVRVADSAGSDVYNAHKRINVVRRKVEHVPNDLTAGKNLLPHTPGAPIGLDVAVDAAEAALAAKTSLAAIQSLIQTYGGGEVSAEQFTGAVFLLRRNPKAVETLGKMLQQSSLDAKQRTLAVDMLVFAGSADSQRVLREAVVSTTLESDEKFRFRVLQRFALLEKPTRETIAFLESEIEAAKRQGADKFHHAALISLGAAIGRADRDAQSVDQLLKMMHEELTSASSSSERSAALVALGNTGDPKQVKALRRYEADGASEIRSSVALALSTIDSRESNAGLLNLATDDDVEVAKTALRPFSKRELEADQRAELERLVVEGMTNSAADGDLTSVIARQADTDPDATKRMLQAVLARQSDDGALAQALRRMLEALEGTGT